MEMYSGVTPTSFASFLPVMPFKDKTELSVIDTKLSSDVSAALSKNFDLSPGMMTLLHSGHTGISTDSVIVTLGKSR